MSRAAAIACAHTYFDNGEFLVDLRRRVAIPSTSQEPERAGALRGYLDDEMAPSLAPLGFTSRVLDNPSGPPFLVAERIEDPALLTILIYGHGDTVRGLDDLWRPGLSPWVLAVEGDRVYGRGTADNKGQHSINIAALAAVLAERERAGARLGFNVKILIEMGEEVGSIGLHELCVKHKDGLLKADVLIASDGPRIAPGQPTIFLGARGGHPIDLVVELREGGHHSGNWGGLLANPGIILAHALACITDARGTILRAGVAAAAAAVGAAQPRRSRGRRRRQRPDASTRIGASRSSRRPSACSAGTASRCWHSPPARRNGRSTPFPAMRGRTASCATWSEPRPTTSFRRCAAISTATALPRSRCASAAPVSSRRAGSIPTIPGSVSPPARSRRRPAGKPTILPNLGASLPNDSFIDVLGLRTIWVPHSYAGCSQHAPDEHLLAPIAREGLGAMAGLFWDIGETDVPRAREP